MKKPVFYLFALTLAVLTSCGGSGSEQPAENSADSTQTSSNMEGMIEFDLTQYQLPLSIMIPDEQTGVPEVSNNELGGVDIVVGKNFGISIVYGIGDMTMLKNDLKEDLVYETTIHEDKPDLLVFEKKIPGYEQKNNEEGGIPPEFHFYFTTNIDGETYDVQNIVGEPYNRASIDKMVASAKSLKGKTAS